MTARRSSRSWMAPVASPPVIRQPAFIAGRPFRSCSRAALHARCPPRTAARRRQQANRHCRWSAPPTNLHMGSRILLVGSGGTRARTGLENCCKAHSVINWWPRPGNPGHRGTWPRQGFRRRQGHFGAGERRGGDCACWPWRNVSASDLWCARPEAALAKGLGDAFAKQGASRFFGRRRPRPRLKIEEIRQGMLMKRARRAHCGLRQLRRPGARAEAFIDSPARRCRSQG